MSTGRVPGHGLERGAPVRIVIDGSPAEAFEGETVAAAVMADRGLELRQTEQHDPRGYFCGMGVCFDCVMTVDGVPNTEPVFVESRAARGAGAGSAAVTALEDETGKPVDPTL